MNQSCNTLKTLPTFCIKPRSWLEGNIIISKLVKIKLEIHSGSTIVCQNPAVQKPQLDCIRSAYQKLVSSSSLMCRILEMNTYHLVKYCKRISIPVIHHEIHINMASKFARHHKSTTLFQSLQCHVNHDFTNNNVTLYVMLHQAEPS